MFGVVNEREKLPVDIDIELTVGALGVVDGVTVIEELSIEPYRFTAWMVKVYAVPLVSPLINRELSEVTGPPTNESENDGEYNFVTFPSLIYWTMYPNTLESVEGVQDNVVCLSSFVP